MAENHLYKARCRFKNVMRQEKLRDYDKDLADILGVSCSGTDECGCDHCLGKDDDFDANGGSRQKRKKIKIEEVPYDSRRTIFTLRLFDRSVELDVDNYESAPPPLYSLCREWLKNKPKKANFESEEENVRKFAEERQEQDENGIYRLPSPKPLRLYFDKQGNKVGGRFPPPLPMVEESKPVSMFIHNHACGVDSCLPSPAVLFQNHLERWVHIRQNWKKAGALNDKRYEASFGILRDMFRELEPMNSQQ